MATFRRITRAFRYTCPVVGPDVLVRPRLLRRLGERWDVRVVVVSAGAGFGKTTLLAQAAEESALDAPGVDVWLTCDTSDASGVTLTRDLAQALGLRPGPEEVVDVSRLAEAVWQRAPGEVAILLDDVHEIPAGSAGAQVLADLVAAMPGNGHLVLAGREPPPVALTRLVAQRAVTVIDEGEIRLWPDEIVSLAALRGVDADALAAMGGWPALTELAIAAGIDTARDFVWEEVLRHLEPERRRAFAAFVAVGGGDSVVASAAAGRPVDVDELVDGLPLVARRARGAAHAHGLWHDVVAGELAPDELGAARRRAAAVLHDQGAHDRAVDLLAAAGDRAGVGRAIVAACTSLRPLWVDRLADRWLEHLGDGAAQEPERLLLAGLRGLVRRPGDDDVADLLRAAAATFRARGDAVGEMAALAHLGYLAWIRHDIDEIAACVARGTELAEGGLTAASFYTDLGRSLLAGRAGDYEAARAALEPIVDEGLPAGWSASVTFLLAMTMTMLGRPDEALGHLGRVSTEAGIEEERAYATLTTWCAGRPDDVLAALPQPPLTTASVWERLLDRLTVALALAHAGRVDEATAAHAACAAELASYPERAFTATADVVVASAIDVELGHETAAAARLRAFLASHPLDDVAFENAFRRFHPLVYVLVPETRAFWDAQAYGTAWQDAREVARALTAVRDGRTPPQLAVTPGRVLTSLPLTLAVELALGLIEDGQDGGRPLLSWLVDIAGAETRAAARRLAGSACRVAPTAKRVLASVPVPPSAPLHLSVLGPAELHVGGKPVEDPAWQRERVRTMLLHLAVHRRVVRDELAAVMWPDLAPEAAAKNLRTTLSYLHGLLEPGRGPGDAPFFVRQDGPALVLHPGEHLSVDAWELDVLLDAAEDADRAGIPSRALEALLAAVGLWRGEYLDDVREQEWARPHRDRARARFVRAGVRAGELLLPVGRADEAVDVATRVLAVEPWSEAAYRVLISAHLGCGDRAAARRAVERCREMLADLDVGPEPTTARAIRAVLDPGSVGAGTR